MSASSASEAAAALSAAGRIVVKIGTSILCGEGEAVRAGWLATLAADIARLRAGGCAVMVVTSGAIALGRKRLKLAGALRLDEKQAASAAGQTALAQAWQEAFEPHDVRIAQILLTLDDTEARRRYLNARATFNTLLELGALPLVNENDTVATSEIRYGDNDRLAAHVAQLTESDALVILSDVDGLYRSDPRKDPSAEHIAVVEQVTGEIEAMASGATLTGVGSGGMTSKIAAAKIAADAGCAVIIAPGAVDHPLTAVLDGGKATLFRANAGARERARRQWISGRLKPAGCITVDAGAVKALKDGASLLPAGVVGVSGVFSRGDAVTVEGPNGGLLGQGLAAYASDEIEKIAGRRSGDIEAILGYRRRPAVIEKDDLVLKT